MAGKRKKLEIPRKRSRNVSRPSSTFVDQIRAAGMRARLVANQPTGSRQYRHIQATLAQEQDFAEMELGIFMRLLRWLVALLLIPVCLISTYTLVCQFSHEAVHQSFWRSKEFLFFGMGAALMVALFCLGVARRTFLLLYVLGHELTHAFFIIFHLGKIMDMQVSPEGGFIATNKSNILISLSPYFFPFWSVTGISVYGIFSLCTTIPWYADAVLYAWIGISWSFHLWWTVWMIPRDQPDLKENDTFFSLVFIYLSNILVLSMMLCAASRSLTFGAFFASWWVNAEEFLRVCMVWMSRW